MYPEKRTLTYLELAVLIGYSLMAQHTERLLKRHRTTTARAADLLLIAGICALLTGAAASYTTWQHNVAARTKAVQLVAAANKQAAKAKNRPAALTPNSAPSTLQPSASAVSSYQVPPAQPRYLIIPKLGVNARVLAVGLTNGAIATPSNVFDTAWYNGSALPGQPGATVIDGHISSWTAHGVFYNLAKLAPGDPVQIKRGDGSMLSYHVVKTAVYNASEVDMSAVLSPVTAGTSGLNLISCYGNVISGTSEFNERVVVFASQT